MRSYKSTSCRHAAFRLADALATVRQAHMGALPNVGFMQRLVEARDIAEIHLRCSRDAGCMQRLVEARAAPLREPGTCHA